MSKNDQSKKQILKRLENYDIFEIIQMAVQQGITCEQMYGHEGNTEDWVKAEYYRLPVLIMDTLDDFRKDKKKNLHLHHRLQ